jgi:hypothetical protein
MTTKTLCYLFLFPQVLNQSKIKNKIYLVPLAKTLGHPIRLLAFLGAISTFVAASAEINSIFNALQNYKFRITSPELQVQNYK